jgi:hypothetical protein
VPGFSPAGGPGLAGPRGTPKLRALRSDRASSYVITGNLGTLVGADFPIPTARNVVVRVDLAGGTRDPSLPVTTVAADGSFTLAGIPSSDLTGALYMLTAAWRTAVPGVRVQAIVLDRLMITADTTLVGLLA